MSEIIRYLMPTKADVASLCAMALQAFSDTFAHLYDPDSFARFLKEAYGPEGRMERDLADPSIRWRIAATHGQPIGYVKLSPLVAPAPAPLPGALELAADLRLGSLAGTRSRRKLDALGARDGTRRGCT